jgi:exodeoxyribonuclease VII large subunit
MTQVFSVGGVAEALDRLIKRHYQTLLVEGEIDQLHTPSSGHAYLVLRDSSASLSCVVWRNQWRQMSSHPSPGDRVICRGRLGVYGPQGRYQMYVDDIQPAGLGRFAKELAARKARLAAEGLLDPRRKRALPKHPRVVGVATSRTGAALQDFLRVSRERFPSARILVAGCQVQGEEAPASVVRAVELLLQDGRAEVVVVTRGGGAKKDLMAFHDESLARYLANVPVPVVSAVGHEVDTSLVDLVADAVAPTPSGAALLVFPDGPMLSQRIDRLMIRLEDTARRRVSRDRRRVRELFGRLHDPRKRLANRRQRVGEQLRRLALSSAHSQARRRERLDGFAGRLHRSSMTVSARHRVQLRAARARLEALSPLAVLDRGYAMVRLDDTMVRSPSDVTAGSRVHVRVAGGNFDARVLESGSDDGLE